MNELLTAQELKRLGYLPVTDGYTPDEEDLFQKALADLKGVDFKIGKVGPWDKAIYRRKEEMK